MAALINNCDVCLNVYVDDCETSIVLPDVNLADSTEYNIVITDKHGNEYNLSSTTSGAGILTIDISTLPEGLLNKYSGFISIEIYDNSDIFTDAHLITLIYGATQYTCINVAVTPETDDTECDNLAIAPIVELFADDTYVTAGQTVRIGWIGLNGTTVTIDNGIGIKPQTGYTDVVINAQTTFTATITNDAGTDTDTLTIYIVAACADASAVLKNSALTVISTTAIASGASANITAPDATAVLKNTLGTVIDTEAIPSNVSEDITIADVSWTDTDGTPQTTAYGVAITCTPSGSLVVDFSVDDTTPDTNQTVTFTDLTVGATTWLWDFGDGEGSDLQNPTHSYKYAGSYTVTLHADDGGGGGFEEKINYITVNLQTVLQTNLAAHYKAGSGASPSNMTLVASAVSQWNDDTANARHLLQGVAASRPAYTAGLLNGYGGVTGDGLNDFLNTGATFARANNRMMFFVMKKLQYRTPDQLTVDSNGASLAIGNTTTMNQSIFNGTAAITQPLYPINNNVIMLAYFNGASSYIQYNDITPTTNGNAGTTAGNGIILLANGAGANNGNYTLYEVLDYSAQLSAGDVTNVLNYLKSKFALW